MEKWEEAYKDYKTGMKYKAIAQKYDVSVNTVKSWAGRKWKALEVDQVAKDVPKVATKIKKGLQPNSQRLQSKEKKDIVSPNRKPGAPKGNQNAVGNSGGAPKGNKNAYKHGLYERLLYSALSEEEKDWFQLQDINEREEIIKEIRLCDIQLMKFMRLSHEASNQVGGLMVSGVNQSKCVDQDGNIKSNTTLTNAVSNKEYILKYDARINSIKRYKLKCLDMLIKLNAQDSGQEEGNSSSIVNIYIPSNDRELK